MTCTTTEGILFVRCEAYLKKKKKRKREDEDLKRCERLGECPVSFKLKGSLFFFSFCSIRDAVAPRPLLHHVHYIEESRGTSPLAAAAVGESRSKSLCNHFKYIGGGGIYSLCAYCTALATAAASKVQQQSSEILFKINAKMYSRNVSRDCLVLLRVTVAAATGSQHCV